MLYQFQDIANFKKDKVKDTKLKKDKKAVNKKDPVENVEIALKEKSVEYNMKNQAKSKRNSIYDNFKIDDWYLHDCLE